MPRSTLGVAKGVHIHPHENVERAREGARILKDSAKRAVGIDPKALGKRGELVACNGVRRHISADDADGRVDGVECPELLGIQANH